MRDDLQPQTLEAPDSPGRSTPHREPAWSPPAPARGRRSPARWGLGLGVLALILGSLGFGVWQHYRRYQTVMTAQQDHRVSLPGVRVDEVRASGPSVGRSIRARFGSACSRAISSSRSRP